MATERPKTEVSLSVKSSPSGRMKINVDFTWNSFLCVCTRNEAGLIMNANLCRAWRKKKFAGTKSRDNLLSIVSCTLYIVNMAFLLLNPLLSWHVQTVWLLMFHISRNAIIVTLTCYTRIKMSRRREWEEIWLKFGKM